MDLSIYLKYCSTACIYFSFRLGPFVHSLEIVQWDSTRRDHPGYPGRVSGSGLVIEWSKEATQAVNLLKTTMKKVPILSLPDLMIHLCWKLMLSRLVWSNCVSKSIRIAFFNHALTGKAQYKLVYERELMAIVMAIQKWRHYLLGRHFIVKIDQKAPKFLLEQRLVATKYQH